MCNAKYKTSLTHQTRIPQHYHCNYKYYVLNNYVIYTPHQGRTNIACLTKVFVLGICFLSQLLFILHNSSIRMPLCAVMTFQLTRTILIPQYYIYTFCQNKLKTIKSIFMAQFAQISNIIKMFYIEDFFTSFLSPATLR